MSITKVGSTRDSYFFGPSYLPNDILKTEQDVEEVLSLMNSQSGIDVLHVLPNFIPGVMGCSGFVGRMKKDAKFHSDILMNKIFGVISVEELSLSDTTWEQIKTKDIDNLWRSCFPIKSEVPPDPLQDNCSTGWAPALSREKGRIGIYETRVERGDSGEPKEVRVLICQSFLPDETYTQFQDWAIDIQKDIQEKKTLSRSSLVQLPGGLHENLSNDGTDLDMDTHRSSFTNQKAFLLTDELRLIDLYKPEGMIGRLLEISKENNRRLMCIFKELLGISFKVEKPIKWGTLKGVDMSTPMEIFLNQPTAIQFRNYYENRKLFEDGEMYRFPEKTKDLLPNNISYAHLKSAMNWWPKGAPIYPFSCLPGDGIDTATKDDLIEGTYPESRLITDKHLKGYPIGWAVLMYRIYKCDKEEERIKFNKEIIEEFDLFYETHPETIKPFVETDFNTFRLEATGDVVWYSESTCIYNPPNGFFVEGPLEAGYYLYNSTVSRATSEKEEEDALFIKELRSTHIHEGKLNEYLNAFPVTFPFEFEITKKIKPDIMKKFTSPLYGGDAKVNTKYITGSNLETKRPPKQLQGTNIVPSKLHPLPLNKSTIAEFAPYLNINSDPIIFNPIKVYISEGILDSQPGHELDNFIF